MAIFTPQKESITIIDGNELIRIDSDFELVSKDVKTVLARGKEIPIEHSVDKYKTLGIEIQDYDNPDQLIDFPSLIRYLDATHTDLFRATASELKTCLPKDLPCLMGIDKWHHKSYFQGFGDKPSSYETFSMIADILIARDPTLWEPTLAANNHWRNWPEAGGL
ncbi:MAG: hypothetical protein AAFP70_07250 [Calditrichota bacterium]